MSKAKQILIDARAADDTLFEEFVAAMKAKDILVVDEIRADSSPEYVFVKLLDRIKDNITYRRDLLERQLAQPLKPQEVKFFERSYIYKHSKYGVHSPLSLSNPAKTKKFSVLFRERIYFLSNEEEQKQFMKEPSRYTQSIETIPLDINIKPKVFVIGLPKSGKSAVCKMLVQKIGVVHLKISKIIQGFMDQDSSQG
jgi:adenylate/nucleoside-diphosphate kinase